MRKLIISSLATALVGSFAFGTAANAFCIDLTSFCDDLRLDFDGANLYGGWDNGTNVCDGTFGSPMFGSVPQVTTVFEAQIGVAANFKLNFGSRLFDLPFWDGVNPPGFFQVGSPFDITGLCPAETSGPTDQPASTAR
jgi:hypothetical protein